MFATFRTSKMCFIKFVAKSTAISQKNVFKTALLLFALAASLTAGKFIASGLSVAEFAAPGITAIVLVGFSKLFLAAFLFRVSIRLAILEATSLESAGFQLKKLKSNKIWC